MMQRRHKYLVLRSTHLILYKKNSDSNKKFSAADIIQSVEFLMDNILVMLGGQVFQQTVTIPMGANCTFLLPSPLLYFFI